MYQSRIETKQLFEQGKKKCSKCKIIKTLDCFFKSKKEYYGYLHSCKECDSIRSQNYRKTEQYRLTNKIYRQRPEVISKAKLRNASTETKEKKRMRSIEYSSTEEYKIKKRKANKKYYEQNKFRTRVSAAVRKSLNTCGRKRGRSWEKLVGYTLQQLKEHIEKQFKNGMSWNTYGVKGWHIDHIRPVSSFNITSTDCEDFKKCWALENLQPLWWCDNLSKNDKYEVYKKDVIL